MPSIGDFINLLALNTPSVEPDPYESRRPKTVKPTGGGVAADTLSAFANLLSGIGNQRRQQAMTTMKMGESTGQPAKFAKSLGAQQSIRGAFPLGVPDIEPSLKEMEADAAQKLATGQITMDSPIAQLIPGIAKHAMDKERLKNARTRIDNKEIDSSVALAFKDFQPASPEDATTYKNLEQEKHLYLNLLKSASDPNELTSHNARLASISAEQSQIQGRAKARNEVKLRDSVSKTIATQESKYINKVPGYDMSFVQARIDAATLPPGPQREAALQKVAEGDKLISSHVETVAKQNDALVKAKIANFNSLISSRTDTLDLRKNAQSMGMVKMLYDRKMRNLSEYIKAQNRASLEARRSDALTSGLTGGGAPPKAEIMELTDAMADQKLTESLDEARVLLQGGAGVIPPSGTPELPTVAPRPAPAPKPKAEPKAEAPAKTQIVVPKGKPSLSERHLQLLKEARKRYPNRDPSTYEDEVFSQLDKEGYKIR